MSSEVQTLPTTVFQPEIAKPKTLVARFASKFGVEPTKLLDTLKATAFKQKEDVSISNEQMMMLLVVAEQHNLNPFTREIYAYPDKNGIVPIVSVDGWSHIINERPEMKGFEFRYSDNIIKMDDDAKPCPEWCEVVIYRSDREFPIVIREYLDEVYKPAFEGTNKSTGGKYKVKGPWQTHTKRFLRHKTLIQGSRYAFGFSGIYDPDEAERIQESASQLPQYVDATGTDANARLAAKLTERVLPAPDKSEPLARAEEPEPPAVEPLPEPVATPNQEQVTETDWRALAKEAVKEFDSKGGDRAGLLKWEREAITNLEDSPRLVPQEKARELHGNLQHYIGGMA